MQVIMLHPSFAVQRSKLSVHPVRTVAGVLWNALVARLGGLSQTTDLRYAWSAPRVEVQLVMGRASVSGKIARQKNI